MVLNRRTMRMRTRPLLLMGTEGLLAFLAIGAAAAVRFDGADLQRVMADGLPARAGLFAAITVTCLYYWDLYDPFNAPSQWEMTARLFDGLAAACVALAAVTFLVPQVALGRGVLLIGVAITVAAIVLWRVALAALSRQDDLQERVLILGTGNVARHLAKELLRRPHLGFRVHGFIDDDPALQGVSIVNPRVVGTTAHLTELVGRHQIGRIVVALDERRGKLPVRSLLDLKLRGVRVHDAASFYEGVTGKILVEGLRPSWIVFSEGFRPSRAIRVAKRAVDVVLSSLGLVFASPVMAVVTILIRADSAGGILFAQERVGEGERPFTLYKFRSMRADAEASTGPVWASENDPRVTRVGRWIRKLRLDELPQLWNVLKGDMSFVGPRPERAHFVAHLKEQVPYYSQRHAVKPGVTGWAQVRYTYGNSVEDALQKLQYDLYYIKNMSLGLDVSIVLQTVKVVLLGRGAV